MRKSHAIFSAALCTAIALPTAYFSFFTNNEKPSRSPAVTIIAQSKSLSKNPNSISNAEVSKADQHTTPPASQFQQDFSDEKSLKSALFKKPEDQKLVTVTCKRGKCDMFASRDLDGTERFPAVITNIIAIQSGIRAEELESLGFRIKHKNPFFPDNDGNLHLDIEKI